jgi:hypothetical protein
LAKEAVAVSAWISVALIIIAVLWLFPFGEFFGMLIFILILLAIPFIVTAMLFGGEKRKS